MNGGREERKRNIIIKGLNVEKAEKEKIKEIMGSIEMEVKIENIRKIETGEGSGWW